MNSIQSLSAVAAIGLIAFNTLFPPFRAHYANEASGEYRTLELGRRWVRTEFTPEYLESVFTGGQTQMAERAWVSATPVVSWVTGVSIVWGLVAVFTWWAFREPTVGGRSTVASLRRRISLRWLGGVGFTVLLGGAVHAGWFFVFRTPPTRLLSFLN
jgi:hypothetical protein